MDRDLQSLEVEAIADSRVPLCTGRTHQFHNTSTRHCEVSMRNKRLAVIGLAFLFPLSVSTARGDIYGLRLVGRAVPGEATASFVTPNRCYLGAGHCL
jgi:hypothetical protein